MKISKITILNLFLIILIFINACDNYVNINQISDIPPGKIVYKEATGNTEYSYFFYIPKRMKKTELNYILITGLDREIISDDYNELTEDSHNQAEWRKDLAELYNYIILVPVIPRSESNQEVYSVSLDRESFSDPTDFYQRPDLKVEQTINEVMKLLRDDGYNIHEKVFIEGFSAAGMFAQRYSLLHPEQVQAIAAGQCGGSITLPASIHNKNIMEWPVGIYDFNTLAGKDFNISIYKKIPQFIYIGDQDNSNSVVAEDNDALFTAQQRNFLNTHFGTSDPTRLKNQCNYMKKLGCNIIFKMYPEFGHDTPTDSMMNDIFIFFDQHK